MQVPEGPATFVKGNVRAFLYVKAVKIFIIKGLLVRRMRVVSILIVQYLDFVRSSNILSGIPNIPDMPERINLGSCLLQSFK